MSRSDPSQTVTVHFPDGPREMPCSIQLDAERPLYTGGVGGVALPKRVPDRIPGVTFIETITGDWIAVRE